MAADARAYFADHDPEIGERTLAAWRRGVDFNLDMGSSAHGVDLTHNDFLWTAAAPGPGRLGNWLSGALLLPRDALKHYREKGWPAAKIIGHFQVSQEMYHWRIRMNGVDVQMGRVAVSITSCPLPVSRFIRHVKEVP